MKAINNSFYNFLMKEIRDYGYGFYQEKGRRNKVGLKSEYNAIFRDN